MNSFGNGVPASYDYINVYNSVQTPSTVHSKNTYLTSYFRRYLLEKVLSRYEFTMPDLWASDYFRYVLFCWGYIAVFDTAKFGVIPQGCGLQGYDVFYRPTAAVVSNPVLGSMKEYTIGKDCVIIKMQPDWGGCLDLVNYYADMMSVASETAGINLLNSRLSYVMGAENKATAETFKKMMDRILSGEPAVVTDTKLFDNEGNPKWSLFLQNVGSSYIAGDIMLNIRQWDAMFDAEIGFPNVNITKKAQMNNDEINANNESTYSKASLWLDTMKEGCKKARDMFGINLNVDFKNLNQYGGMDNESLVVDTRNVPVRRDNL